MSLCVTTVAGVLALTATDFTLSWTHSVERVAWLESWSMVPGGLKLREARVRGSGAGMEVPDGARLVDGWWVYAPALPPQPVLTLAASGATGGGWNLCADRACRTLGAEPEPPITISECAGARDRQAPIAR